MPKTPRPMFRLDPVLIASRWTCGDLPPENVTQMAVELIDAGHQEPSVYRVAAEDKVNSRDEVEALLERMFSALGVAYPMSLDGARQIVAQQIAREVMVGLKDPWIAALQLDRAVPHWETKDANILAICGIADEAEWDRGCGRSVSTLERELIQAFERLACLSRQPSEQYP